MNTNERCIKELNTLKTFFELNNVNGWVERTNIALKEINNESNDLKTILDNYFGYGMGSFTDLNICTENGFKLTKSEVETNNELNKLAENLLMIKQNLKK
jgi:hypothetical protein